MLEKIIKLSIANKAMVLLFTAFIVGFGLFSLSQLPIGAVPDVTNNQVQVITTSRNLSTQDVEQFITYPVELEMANLPGVKEIRSVSKFGLSVVTIVFDDDLGNYLPRQLIAEKLKTAAEKIPQGFGTPEMGPITTGLGEIYQYTLEVAPNYKSRYSVTDLRTIQDWIVKRQLSGISGVVEVNTWGGYLKQYEVAINTQKLQAFNIQLQEVFTAVEKNNSVAGGAYIEKTNEAYFIRGDGKINKIEDIEQIVVANRNGLPVTLGEVATVGFGSAPRFGAITGNGEGEKVLGQVMMLKDANSSAVINAVKDRVSAIASTLPEGVYINPFLERSELIAKTTFTISENLILGCLIVVFVVVLLLGNLRSGLLVASVIPLCLLFALSLMYLFGVDANLMSLGAIDFGIIIDGAVIIVEYTAFKISSHYNEMKALPKKDYSRFKDKITREGATKMMNSAVFGQLIILIVFIPVLSLSGVEGKMFRPMALTFSFALIGAMILCFTYVPVASSLFLKPAKQDSKNLSQRLIAFLTRTYEPFLAKALQLKKIVLAASAFLLLLGIGIFASLGGEFVPTLDEGDFVIQPVLKTGTSLSKTIETTTKIEQILLKNFPEVDQVVSRIGAAEVPTDPMSMEEVDVIVKLKPKKEWKTADTKDGLADAFKEALRIIPGMEVEFTQPIEMRFNELITGVRADLAIKVFGENLEILNQKAQEIKGIVQNIEGAADISVEKITGLPQMLVQFKRDKIARYGLNIEEVNRVITTGFAGQAFGVVFEGEKRFDLVVRLEKSQRDELKDLQNLMIDTPAGIKIPLSEVAQVQYFKGPAKISRDDTKRRIVIGINVRNRDLQSVVDEARSLIETQLTLPPGYTITYGGQFENLNSAKARLKLAVPVALLLIFIFLHLAFGSLKDALMIYTAIPLSAVGGVLALWLRDMPFSISAGVGFIALFGIAVLNGIVLIEHFKELKSKGMENTHARIIRGAKERLRPVLLTAAAAALGFLPMAISTNAGAEVQRPLATVVIGGLITSSLLTMIVLPVLYAVFDKTQPIRIRKSKNKMGVWLLVLGLSVFSASAHAQQLSAEQALEVAFKNNRLLQSDSLAAKAAAAQTGLAFTFDKTDVYYSRDENNLAINGEPLNVFGIQQNFLFPTVYGAYKKNYSAQAKSQKSIYELRRQQLAKQVMSQYYQLKYVNKQVEVFDRMRQLYTNFAKAAEKRFELGASDYLEKITAQARQKKIVLMHQEAVQNAREVHQQLAGLLQLSDTFSINSDTLLKLNPEISQVKETYQYRVFEAQKKVSQTQLQLENQKLLPDWNVEYFTGSNGNVSNLSGYKFGIKIPLLFFGQQAQIKTARISRDIAQMQSDNFEVQYQKQQKALLERLQKFAKNLVYYENEGKQLSQALLHTAEKSYQSGEINYFQYIQSVEASMQMETDYLDALNQYNQTVISLNYLMVQNQ